MTDIWRETALVRFGSVDRSDRLTLWSIFNFFQEGAISHAADLGVGRDSLADSRQAWVLSRLSIFIERRPAFGEKIEISTWPRGGEKLFAFRDYTIRDAGGYAVVRGRGAWLVLDVDKQRPLRPQAILESLPLNDGYDAFPSPAGPAALGQNGDPVKVGERKALYSDIDYYGHVNNARYVQWIQDAADFDILTKADQIRLDINYLSQVRPGETVELWAVPLPEAGPPEGGNRADYPFEAGPGFSYEGRRADGQAVFRAELRTGQGPSASASG